MNFSIGINGLHILTFDSIEHSFSSEISIQVQILAWASLFLINLLNGYLIHVIKNKMNSTLDWLILMDCILCILNCIPIIHLGIIGTSFKDDVPLCLFFNFSGYFINVSNRLVTIGISTYRYVFVIHFIKMEDRFQRQIFIDILFSVIILTPTFLTGYAIYYRDSYQLYQRKNVLDVYFQKIILSLGF